jgi:hypothetical protein
MRQAAGECDTPVMMLRSHLARACDMGCALPDPLPRPATPCDVVPAAAVPYASDSLLV